FSHSNALTWICRYSSVYHWKQTIATYTAHVDTFEMYANLSQSDPLSFSFALC
ncbi:hypothetical protein B0H17DRAFT_959109, partial [Mycena rosella]